MSPFVPTHDPKRQGSPVDQAPEPSLLLPVLADKHAKGWPEHEIGRPAVYLQTSEAFTRRWSTDAHVAAYSVPAHPRRLARAEALTTLAAEGGIPMVLAVFDLDAPDHQATEDWFAEQWPRVDAVQLRHPGLFAYRTRGGYRLVWRLAVPYVLRSVQDAADWRRLYQRWCCYLARAVGLVADPSCADWTRLYRLPHATREGGGAPEELPTWGDPAELGTFEVEPRPEELADDARVAGELAATWKLWAPVAKALGEVGQGGLAPAGGALRGSGSSPARALLTLASGGPLSSGPLASPPVGAPGGLPLARAEQDERQHRRLEGYARGALARAVDELKATPAGNGRNNVLNAKAYALGRFVGAGLLGVDDVERALLEAARGAGLPEFEARTTLQSGLARGIEQPRLPELHPEPAPPGRLVRERAPSSSPRPPGEPEKNAYLGIQPPEAALQDHAERGLDPEAPPPRGARRRILVDHELHRLVNQELDALAAAPDLNLYTRNGELVQVLRSTDELQGRRDAGMPYLRPLPIDALWTMLVEHADFYRLVHRGAEATEVPCLPPAQSIKSLFAAGEWPGLRSLVGVLETPFLRPDGSVCSSPGYDPSTGYLLLTQEPFPEVPEYPTHDDARAALAVLEEPFCDFPFTSDVARTVPLAAFLTVLARPALGAENTPCFVFDANTRGTGKSLICNVVCLLATGRAAPKTGYPASDEEMGKLLASVALGGVPLLVFDNVTTTVGGGNLDLVLTSHGAVAFRMLGAIRNKRCAWRAIVMATGNNVAIRGDTSRRVLVCEQETLAERPEEREDFRHPDLPRHVLEHRARYVAAALTLLRAYHAAGAPRMVRPLGSFEAWSKLVAGALVWAGAANPLDALAESSRDDDPQKAALRILLEQWPKVDSQGAGLTVRELVAQLYPGGTPGGESLADLRDAVEVLCGLSAGRTPSTHQVARRLRTFERRVLGGRRLVQAGGRGGISRWSVEFAKKESP